MSKPKAIIFDLDGTLFDVRHREHYVNGQYEEKDYDKFYGNICLDTVYPWALKMLKLYTGAGHYPIFSTGRPANYREPTVERLQTCVGLFPGNYLLLMRPEKDFKTHDTVIKENHYKKIIEPWYDVELVVEDRARVVDHWRSLGLVTLQCAKGDF